MSNVNLDELFSDDIQPEKTEKIENIEETEEDKTEPVSDFVEEEVETIDEMLEEPLEELVEPLGGISEELKEDTIPDPEPKELESTDEVNESHFINDNDESKDGVETGIVDEDIIDDYEYNEATSTGVATYNIPETIANKDLLFGQSNLDADTNKESQNPLDLIKSFKYYGEYLDVYLPMSDIAVRIYEFDVKVFLEKTLDQLVTTYTNMLLLDSYESAIISKRILEQIRENSVFLCKDAAIVNSAYSFDMLSHSDIKLILLGAVALLTYVSNDKKNYLYNTTTMCRKCDANIDVELDLIQLLKQQYNKLDKLEVQKNIDNYNTEETYTEKTKRSPHYKKYSVKYNKKEKTLKLVLADPSYGAKRSLEENLYKHLLETHRSLVSDLSEDIPNFRLYAPVRKVGLILDAMRKNNIAELTEEMTEFNMDYNYMQIIPYIHAVVFEHHSKTGSPTVKTTYLDEETPSMKLDIIKRIPDSLISKAAEGIMDKIVNKGIKPIELTTVCNTCGYKDTQEFNPVSFFFSVIDTLITKLRQID